MHAIIDVLSMLLCRHRWQKGVETVGPGQSEGTFRITLSQAGEVNAEQVDEPEVEIFTARDIQELTGYTYDLEARTLEIDRELLAQLVPPEGSGPLPPITKPPGCKTIVSATSTGISVRCDDTVCQEIGGTCDILFVRLSSGALYPWCFCVR